MLRVENLTVHYALAARPAVDGVSFQVDSGETLGLVGESGSGKSTIVLAVMRALPAGASVDGVIGLDGVDVRSLQGRTLRRWWSDEVAMVYQEPQAALNPTMRVGAQIAEVLRTKGVARDAARDQSLTLLERVAMPDPPSIWRRFPHQLSGGQQQRVVIAMALVIRPKLLVLDEPTTGLDATVEREILDLIAGLRGELSAAVLFITHDLGLVERMCDRVGVLQAGRVQEHGPVANVLVAPSHEYTSELLASAITAGRTKHNDPAVHKTSATSAAPAAGRLLMAHGIVKRYGDVVANGGVSLRIDRGEVVGLVGESGSGKTTLGRVIAGLTVPDEGSIQLAGTTIAPDLRDRRPEVRRSIQMVFQSPESTLNPRHRVGDVLRRAIKKLGGRRTVDELATACRLDADQLGQLTSTLSGGQKQRVAIARAIAGDADLVVCDEPVSALDVSVQATILRLLVELQARRGMALLFVSHDLAVVRYLSDRIAVMYAGTIVEEGPVEAVLAAPFHPYTAALLAASERRSLSDEPPQATNLRSHVGVTPGCVYAACRPHAIAGMCDTTPPPLRRIGDTLTIACHLDLASAGSRADGRVRSRPHPGRRSHPAL